MAYDLFRLCRSRGFTLVEVLVVLLVVAVLLGYISLSPVSDCRRCANEVFRLQKTMELVRDEAILRYRSLRMRIYPDRYLVDISPEDGDDLADLATLARDLPRGCRLQLPESLDAADITFLPQGLATPVEFDLSCNDKDLARITVDRGGGIEIGFRGGE